MVGLKQALRVYENVTLVNVNAFTGSGAESFYLLSGSRMLITLMVTEADAGATINLYVDNGFDTKLTYDMIETLSVVGSGTVKRVITDFNNLFNFRYSVTGGMATVRVGVAVFDNAGTTRIDNAQIAVNLDHTVDALGHFDSTRIGDGKDLLAVNDDGSINVVIVDSQSELEKSYSNRIAGVIQGGDVSLLTYTVPTDTKAYLTRLEVSGENIAKYDLYLNGVWLMTKRTSFGEGFNTTFEFEAGPKRGQVLQPGEIINIKVSHERPAASKFEARLQVLEKSNLV